MAGGLTVRLYIAGPMRGFPLFNFPAFDEAERYLLSLGFEVVNPAEIDRRNGFDPSAVHPLNDFTDEEMATFFMRDVDNLMLCDGVVLLPGWEHSIGATAEFHIARWLRKQTLIYPHLLAFEKP